MRFQLITVSQQIKVRVIVSAERTLIRVGRERERFRAEIGGQIVLFGVNVGIRAVIRPDAAVYLSGNAFRKVSMRFAVFVVSQNHVIRLLFVLNDFFIVFVFRRNFRSKRRFYGESGKTRRLEFKSLIAGRVGKGYILTVEVVISSLFIPVVIGMRIVLALVVFIQAESFVRISVSVFISAFGFRINSARIRDFVVSVVLIVFGIIVISYYTVRIEYDRSEIGSVVRSEEVGRTNDVTVNDVHIRVGKFFVGVVEHAVVDHIVITDFFRAVRRISGSVAVVVENDYGKIPLIEIRPDRAFNVKPQRGIILSVFGINAEFTDIYGGFALHYGYYIIRNRISRGFVGFILVRINDRRRTVSV